MALQGGDFRRYLQLYNAAIAGEWETAYEGFFVRDRESLTAVISFSGETALHVAARSSKSNDFVNKLVELMPREALERKDRYGYTALHNAARVGNTEAAKAMVDKNPDLLYMPSLWGNLAVTTAAEYCQKETVEFLISALQRDVDNAPLRGPLGVKLLVGIIRSEFFDFALALVQRYPELSCDGSALTTMAEMDTLFPSGFTEEEKWIYREVAPQEEQPGNARSLADGIRAVSDWLLIWGPKDLDPRVVKKIEDKIKKIREALQLFKYLCEQMVFLPEEDGWNILGQTITRAAKNGISEIVEVIMKMYPEVTGYADTSGGNIMLLAARNRFDNVFNLAYKCDQKHLLTNGVDSEGNNLMHMCAKLAPPDRLNLVAGAALQMQLELRWFNYMETCVPPAYRMSRNKQGKTPKMLFTEEHTELKAEAERWMKEMANACTIAAALIATVAFAAAFTVPGGVAAETGIPVFAHQIAFVVFGMTNTISLFFSIASLLMLLVIVSSRYAEGDLFNGLPQKLTLALSWLITSIAVMMVAFTSALFLLFRGQERRFIIPVAVFCWLSVSFVLSKPILPLVKVALYWEDGTGIFGRRKSKGPPGLVDLPTEY